MAENRYRLGMQLRLGGRIEIEGHEQHRPFGQFLDVVVDAAHFRRNVDRQADRIEQRHQRTEPDHQENNPAVDL
jgi:hypothetical protein